MVSFRRESFLSVLRKMASELRMWISEKKILLSQEDFGDNLATVAGLKKKHDALLRDIGDHEEKGKMLSGRADKLNADVGIVTT